MNVGIIGCGFIGEKRATALAGCRLVACSDIVTERAFKFASTKPGVVAEASWEAVIQRADVELVVVATTHDALAKVTLAAVRAGKHVLVEKPAARNAAELNPVIAAAVEKGVLVRVGFNHRYHPSFIKAREIVTSGVLGDLMFVRGRYGHGGRPGYEKEWRAMKELSGGGELIDQGVHLIDLARVFLGNFSEINGFAHTYFWNMPVEDNGFMLLKTARKQVAFLHASWTEWKNTFSFEIYGKYGKLDVTGLGGSYGVERLAYYKMLRQMGPPETIIWEYPMADNSWDMEFAEFLEDIQLGRQPAAGLADARAALEIVESIYQGSNQ
jgi:predicted dehydrogenase